MYTLHNLSEIFAQSTLWILRLFKEIYCVSKHVRYQLNVCASTLQEVLIEKNI